MKQLTVEQFASYMKDPNGMGDTNVRRWCNVPDDKYYTVAVWPEASAGQVRINTTMSRVVKAKKVSKSDQP